MSVEDWARREAEKKYPTPGPVDWNVGASVAVERNNFADGIVHAFSALLSDEAWDFLPRWNDEEGESITRAQAIRLVQAAVDAVTEGDTE